MINYTPIKKQKIFEQIMEKIRQSIEKGDLHPGDKLPSERELAAMFSVSRGAVREAIGALASRGIIIVKPGLGNFLAALSNEELLNLFNLVFVEGEVNLLEMLEWRQGIESNAAYYAAARRTEQDLHNIREALEKLEYSMGQLELAAEEDFKFHNAIMEASHNTLMINTFKLISTIFRQGVYEARIDALKIPGKSEIVLNEHRLIYQAILEGNPEKACQAMNNHIVNIGDQVETFS
ncbi:FadR/GntR family transcriptional regulator [Ammoniphilus sp. YIM 78166]|uniref:FadR/GntR family transcriptional regulator n=1 Tax=Ammoniphilus sp. YIM 78166 TaxID=1644106 RepID=UPI001070206D|nr:FadR/GntR family transcriptional regulator [Ammoniphilus sp. YIM 78166]